jgi:hypothetical protein
MAAHFFRSPQHLAGIPSPLVLVAQVHRLVRRG